MPDSADGGRVETRSRRLTALVLGNAVSATVVLGCLLIAGVLVWQLNLQLNNLNAEPSTVAIRTLERPEFLRLAPDERREMALFALEHDAQHLRTKRAQSLLGARLFVQAITVLAGISLLVMGSAFVFARIKTSQPNIIDVQAVQRAMKLESYSPGLVLAALGCCLIVVAAFVSLQSKTLTEDSPVFFRLAGDAGGSAAKPTSQMTGPEFDDHLKKLREQQ